MQEDLIEILLKKSLGYEVDEISVEYDGEGSEIKRKVVTKYIPPDVAALKTYLELVKEPELVSYTDEELKKEKKRLLKKLSSID